MKELSIEEKAQAYDEALSVALETYQTQPMYRDWLEKMFPELAESEDEKIRKALVRFHKSTIDVDGIKGEKILAWLEKRGNLMKALQISNARIGELIEKNYYLKEQLEKQDKKKSIDELTQQEAMDIAVAKCFEQGEQNLANSAKTCKDEQKPAWSEEDDNTLLDTINILRSCGRCSTDRKLWLLSLKDRVQPQSQPVWSKEDEETLDYIIAYIEKQKSKDTIYTKKTEVLEGMIVWLKSLKDRYTWKPSEEQMNALEHFVRSVGESGYASPYDNDTKFLYSLIAQLKKLREE